MLKRRVNCWNRTQRYRLNCLNGLYNQLTNVACSNVFGNALLAPQKGAELYHSNVTTSYITFLHKMTLNALPDNYQFTVYSKPRLQSHTPTQIHKSLF